jgi:hypothetical protein
VLDKRWQYDEVANINEKMAAGELREFAFASPFRAENERLV